VQANNDDVRGDRLEELTRFLRFALVGTIGFVVDASVLRLVVAIFGINLYAGRVVSFLAAATVTWHLNRTFTFRHNGPRAAQWLRFIAANAFGAGVNFGTYATMITIWPVAREYPSIAVGCGSLAGMALNFVLMKKLVFR
jgi:putative flippase GtrA